MQLPSIPGLTGSLAGLASLAAFVRDRLGEAGSLWSRRDDAASVLTDGRDGSARQLAVVIVAAAAPFAPTSYARARLLRQMHASGLLTARETQQAEQLLGVAQ